MAIQYTELRDEDSFAQPPNATEEESVHLDHLPVDESVLFRLPVVDKPVTLLAVKYTMYLLCGIANLWPWNCFLSASEYFSDRLKEKPALADNFSSSMMTVWTLTSTAYNYYLSQRQAGADYVFRLKFGSALQVVVFLMMTLSVLLPKGQAIIYFIFVNFNVALSSIAASLVQVGLIALVNVQGARYANANVIGNAIAGVMPSISMIAAVLSNSSGSRTGEAVKYFLTSVAVTLVSLISINTTEKAEKLIITDEEPDTTTVVQQTYIPLPHLWSILWKVETAIILDFAFTLVFPIFAVDVESSKVDKKVFIPVAFLVWNSGDLVGRIACGWPAFVLNDQNKMMIYAIARALFFPLLWHCNVHGKGGFNDYVYLALQFLFGFSNGQLFSSAFMKIGQLLSTEDEKKAAGGFTALIINLSLLLGSITSYIWVIILG